MNLIDAYDLFIEKKEYGKAFDCLKRIVSGWEYYPMLVKFRELIRDNRELLKETYKLTARDNFDDFMIFIEWDRPLAEKFWLPRRAKLMPICQALQELEDGLLDELFLSQPPRTGKTTLMMFFCLWIMFRNSERSNLYCSYSDNVAKTLYNGIIEVLTDTTTYIWKELFHSDVATTDAKDLTINLDRRKRYSSFTARSIGGSLNGSVDCNGYLIADDLISGIEEAMNRDRLMSAWLKVENNMIPRAKQSAKILWIGTRWSLSDPIEMRLDVLRNEPKYKEWRYKTINVPALNEEDESNFEYACGVGFNTEYYQQRRASFERNNDIASWLAQYQGTPIEREGSLFMPEDFRYFNGVMPDGDPDRVYMVVDPAWGGGDFVASPLIYQFGNDLFIKDVVYNNGEKTVTQPEIVNKAIANNVSAIYVEGTRMTSSYGEGIEDMLLKKGYKCNVTVSTKHFTGNGKEQRIFDKAPDIREHMVFLRQRSKEYESFLQNVFSFTMNGKNKHDDAPDSLAMAISYTFMSSVAISVRQRPF